MRVSPLQNRVTPYGELVATKAELNTSRAHLKERISEVETLTAQLSGERAKAPTDAMSQRVTQLTTSVKAKERELGKLREGFVPYALGQVDLADDLRVTGIILGSPESVKIGMRLCTSLLPQGKDEEGNPLFGYGFAPVAD